MSKMKKIFICEDDEAIIEIVQVVLEQKGYRVDFSTDGKSAMKKITALKPDLLLIDLWMPVVNGEEIIGEVKKNKATENIPVIIFSASREIEFISKKLGVKDFLRKPFDIYELEEKVGKLLLAE
jgi:CheY-like chemotaxis protein